MVTGLLLASIQKATPPTEVILVTDGLDATKIAETANSYKWAPGQFAKLKLVVIYEKDNLKVVIPETFGGISKKQSETKVLEDFILVSESGKSKELEALPNNLQKDVESVFESSSLGRGEWNPKGRLTCFSSVYFTLGNGKDKVSFSLNADTDYSKRALELAETPAFSSDKGENREMKLLPVKSLPKPSLAFQISSGQPISELNKVRHCQVASEIVTKWTESAMKEIEARATKALSLLGDPQSSVFGQSDNVIGDKSRLPKSTVDALHSQLLDSWKSMGFKSYGDAEKFWKESKIEGSFTSLQLSVCTGKIGVYPIISQVEVARK